MKAPYIPLLTVLVLSLFALPVSFDLMYSPVPGWHTTIAPPHPIAIIQFVIVVLFLVLTGYWFSTQPATKTDWIIFAVYLLLIIPAVALLLFPSVISTGNSPDDFQTAEQIEQLIVTETKRVRQLLSIRLAFFAGQLFFFIYCIRGIWLARRR